jgi:hypothetical protein
MRHLLRLGNFVFKWGIVGLVVANNATGYTAVRIA